MKYRMLLDEDDIREIIADKFGVPVDDVKFKYYEGVEGYGVGEHVVQKVSAEVSGNENSFSLFGDANGE